MLSWITINSKNFDWESTNIMKLQRARVGVSLAVDDITKRPHEWLLEMK